MAVALAAPGFLAVILSWPLVNTVFAFRYARLYYRDEPEGGINFKQDQSPTYVASRSWRSRRHGLRGHRDRTHLHERPEN